MSTFERLINVCKAVFEDELDLTRVTEDSNLREDIGINSVGLLYMAMALEEEFEIKFTNDDFIDLKTVKDVVGIIDKKVN